MTIPHHKALVNVPSIPPISDEQCVLSVKPYTAAEAGRWDAFVRNSPGGTFCHLSGWLRVVARVWGYPLQALLAERGGQIVGVLPLALVQSCWFGARLISTPNAVYGGVLTDEAAANAALLTAARQLAYERSVDFLELRDVSSHNFSAQGVELHQQDLYVTFTHALEADPEALLRSFPRDIRRMIRQGEKHGLTSEIGGLELLDEFYDVYAASVRNLGTPVFPKRLFAEFLREFPDASDILVVRQGRQTAGAVLSFYFRDTVLPYYGGAYPAFYRAGVSNFMYWELMRRAAARGFTRFDFGRSKRGTGACEFKRGWRMTEQPLPYKFLLVRAQSMPELNPLNPKFKLFIATWKRLPLSLTKWIGPQIVKHLP